MFFFTCKKPNRYQCNQYQKPMCNLFLHDELCDCPLVFRGPPSDSKLSKLTTSSLEVTRLMSHGSGMAKQWFLGNHRKVSGFLSLEWCTKWCFSYRGWIEESKTHHPSIIFFFFNLSVICHTIASSIIPNCWPSLFFLLLFFFPTFFQSAKCHLAELHQVASAINFWRGIVNLCRDRRVLNS